MSVICRSPGLDSREWDFLPPAFPVQACPDQQRNCQDSQDNRHAETGGGANQYASPNSNQSAVCDNADHVQQVRPFCECPDKPDNNRDCGEDNSDQKALLQAQEDKADRNHSGNNFNQAEDRVYFQVFHICLPDPYKQQDCQRNGDQDGNKHLAGHPQDNGKQ